MKRQKLLTTANPKTSKGVALGYHTAILHLAPADVSGTNLCPFSSAGCRAACLYTAGRGAFRSVQNARLKRTRFFLRDRRRFEAQLCEEIEAHARSAERKRLVPCYRLGGTHESNFLHIVRRFPRLQFYDYVKSPKRARDYINGKLPDNYHVTFSRSEKNDAHARDIVHAGCSVAVVFRDRLPARFYDRPVINGDESDLRFLDLHGVVVGLTAKGKARQDKTGFVVDL